MPPSEPVGAVELKLRAARYWITVSRPYYSRALFACRLLVTTAVDTMSIDRSWRIYANPDHVDSFSVAETAGLLIHNLNHVLRDHAQRAGVLSAEALWGDVWPTACDCEINDDLAADGLTLPEGLAFPYMFDMGNGRTAEQYYRGLFEGGHVERVAVEFGHSHDGSSGGSGVTGIAASYELADEGLSEAEQELLRHATAQAVRDHAASSGIGEVPEGLRRWADARLDPKVDWRKALASALRRALHKRAGAADYSWQRPPRRQRPGSALQFPGMVQPVPSVAAVIDTSASMSDDDLAQATAEIGSILTRVVPGHAIRVLSVDASVARDTRVFAKRQIELRGGGGTDMRVGIAEAAKAQPAAIVVITDGYTPWPDHRPRGTHTVIAAIVNPHEHRLAVPDWIQRVDVA